MKYRRHACRQASGEQSVAGGGTPPTSPQRIVWTVACRAPGSSGQRDVSSLLAPGDITAVTQPIVRVADGQTVGFEVLARSRSFSLHLSRPMARPGGSRRLPYRRRTRLPARRARARHPARTVPGSSSTPAPVSCSTRRIDDLLGRCPRARPGGHRARAIADYAPADRAAGRPRPARDAARCRRRRRRLRQHGARPAAVAALHQDRPQHRQRPAPRPGSARADRRARGLRRRLRRADRRRGRRGSRRAERPRRTRRRSGPGLSHRPAGHRLARARAYRFRRRATPPSGARAAAARVTRRAGR